MIGIVITSQLIKNSHNGFAYFLLAVNVFPKKLFMVDRKLKTKSSREVADALKSILHSAKLKFKHI